MATKEEPALIAADFRFDSIISSKAASTRTDVCSLGSAAAALRSYRGNLTEIRSLGKCKRIQAASDRPLALRGCSSSI